MNSVTSRNAAFLLILYLLWVVFSGIYKNHSPQELTKDERELQQPQIAGEQRARLSPTISAPTSIASSSEGNSTERSLTGEDIRQIAMTGRLPSWVKNSKNKRLNLEEIEEIMSTGKLPKL